MILKGKIKNRDLAIISENLGMLYEDGINLSLALKMIEDLDISKKYKLSIKKIKNDVEAGASLGNAFKKFRNLYPDLFLNMLDAAEKSGSLGEVLNGLSKYYKNLEAFSQESKSRLLMIKFAFGISIIGILVGIFFVIPNFSTIIEDKENLPFITKSLLNFSLYASKNTAFIIEIIITWIIGMYILYKVLLKDKIRKIFVRKVSFFREGLEYEVMLVIGLIIKSGVNLTKGLEDYAKENTDFILKEIFEKICKKILEGETLGNSIEKSFNVSEYSKSMVNIGESSGNLENRFERIVEVLEKNRMKKLDTMVNMIQPVYVLLMSIVILFTIFTFVMPIMDSIMGGVMK